MDEATKLVDMLRKGAEAVEMHGVINPDLVSNAADMIQRLAAEVERHNPKQLTDDEACILLNEIAYDGACDWTPDDDGHGYIQSASLRQGMGTWTAHAIAAQVLREKESKK